MARTPKNWLTKLTDQDKKDADELEARIEQAMDKDAPSYGHRNHFQYDFSKGEKTPNERVQDEIVKRYGKSPENPDGWSKIDFQLGGGRQDGGGGFIRFEV